MTRIQHVALLLCLAAVMALATGQKTDQKTERKSANLQFLVVKESNGKPVKNAEVILHPVDKGKQKEEGLELKTHEDGKAEANGIPYGKMRIQVIAHGFRTYGQDFEVDQANLEITIKLQKPADQFSIYK
jgi:hypothetical protein